MHFDCQTFHQDNKKSFKLFCVLAALNYSMQLFVNSGGASTVKEPGHFEVRKSSSQVTRMHFFIKKVDDLF